MLSLSESDKLANKAWAGGHSLHCSNALGGPILPLYSRRPAGDPATVLRRSFEVEWTMQHCDPRTEFSSQRVHIIDGLCQYLSGDCPWTLICAKRLMVNTTPAIVSLLHLF